jgi:hypothetical protein
LQIQGQVRPTLPIVLGICAVLAISTGQVQVPSGVIKRGWKIHRQILTSMIVPLKHHLHTGAKRREFSGMIHAKSLVNHPSNPQQPIHSLRLAPVSL